MKKLKKNKKKMTAASTPFCIRRLDLSFPVLAVLRGNQQNFRRGEPTLEIGKLALGVSCAKLSLF